MFKINSNYINNIKLTQSQNSKPQSFTSNPDERNIQSLSNVQADYSLKTPIPYSKIEDINLPYDIKAHYYKLANGQKIVIVPKEGPTVVKTYINSGSMNEPDKIRGISHYIEHNLFNGSDGLEEGEFFKVADKMGASTNASTGFAETNYYIKSNLLNQDDLENKIKIHASMLETPHFKQEKLDKEKGIVNSEINMILSRPENIGVNKTLKNLYNIQSSSIDMIGGTTDNITNLTREDVIDYYNKNYYPANMLTVITGEVKPDETIKFVSKYFSSKKQPPAYTVNEELKPIEKAVREDIISDKATATSIFLGFNGPQNLDTKAKIYLDAVTRILTNSSTSRINKALRPFNTSVWSEFENISTKPTDGKAILFSVDTTEGNSENILKNIYKEIHGIKVKPPTDEEMQIVKKSMLKSFSSVFENSFAINDMVGSIFLNSNKESIENLKNYEDIINKMTADDLVNTAKKYLDLNKSALTVIHPNTTTADTINSNYKSVSFTGNKMQKKQALNLDKVTEYKAFNNFKIVTNDINTRNSSFNVNFICDKPMKTKPATPFILSGLLSEGSAFKDEFEFKRNLERNGIDSSFSCTDSVLTADSYFDVDDMTEALKTTKEVIQNPRFTQESLNQVKNDIKEAISMSEKSANKNINTELFKGTINGYSYKEILESIDNVTLDDIKELHNYLLTNSKAQIVVSAPFNKKPEAKQVLFNETSTFNHVKEFKPFLNEIYTPIEKTKVITEIDNKNQADIIQAYKFKTNSNLKDEISIALLNYILGGGPSSRLFNDLRETEKLAYSVRSRIQFNNDIGTLKLSIGTTTENNETTSYDNVQKAITGFHRHIEKMLNEKVTDEELNNAKLSLKNDILNVNENTANKTDSLSSGSSGFYGISYENQKLDMIDKITADDIYNAAHYIFSSKPTYSIIATKNTLKYNAEFLKSLQ